jgi:hypothetical protein
VTYSKTKCSDEKLIEAAHQDWWRDNLGEKKMKITEQEFDAIRQGLRAAFNEGCLDENVAYPAFDKMKEVYKRYRWFKDQLSYFDPSELQREYIEEFGSWGKGE